MDKQEAIEQELQERHNLAKLAFSRRDVDMYRQLFSPSLVYLTIYGGLIGRDELMQKFAADFQRYSDIQPSFFRHHLGVAGDQVSETLVQVFNLQVTKLRFFHQRFKLKRCGSFTWRKIEGVWVIEHAEILFKIFSNHGWQQSIAAHESTF